MVYDTNLTLNTWLWDMVLYHRQKWLNPVAEPRIRERCSCIPWTFKFYTWWHCFNVTWTSWYFNIAPPDL